MRQSLRRKLEESYEHHIDYAEVVKCAVALGKRQFILEVLPKHVLDQTIDRSHLYTETKPKKKWRLW